MGNDQTTLQHKDMNRLQMSNYLEITAQHNKKLYHKNIKPFKAFQSIIKTIHVRVAYLNYDWAVFLCSELTKNSQKIYLQYCEDFKLCILKQSQNSEYFQPKCLSEKFFTSLRKAENKLQKVNFTNSELESLFEEIKCYFMVQNWFKDLPLNNPTLYLKATLDSYQTSKENINIQKPPQFSTLKKNYSSEIDCQKQKIYSILLKLTQKFFDNHYSFERQLKEEAKQSLSPKMNPIKRFSTKQASFIKLIARESNFRQRQIYIGTLLSLLFKKYQNEKQKLQTFPVQQNKIHALIEILGLKRVYCVLRIMTELGEIQQMDQANILFSFIQKFVFIEKLQKQNDQKSKSHSPLKMRQSPSKKSKQNNKVKTQNIR